MLYYLYMRKEDAAIALIYLPVIVSSFNLLFDQRAFPPGVPAQARSFPVDSRCKAEQAAAFCLSTKVLPSSASGHRQTGAVREVFPEHRSDSGSRSACNSLVFTSQA